MHFLIFFCYELSVCPLILKSDKVYFLSSLIAKPTLGGPILGALWRPQNDPKMRKNSDFSWFLKQTIGLWWL